MILMSRLALLKNTSFNSYFAFNIRSWSPTVRRNSRRSNRGKRKCLCVNIPSIWFNIRWTHWLQKKIFHSVQNALWRKICGFVWPVETWAVGGSNLMAVAGMITATTTSSPTNIWYRVNWEQSLQKALQVPNTHASLIFILARGYRYFLLSMWWYEIGSQPHRPPPPPPHQHWRTEKDGAICCWNGKFRVFVNDFAFWFFNSNWTKIIKWISQWKLSTVIPWHPFLVLAWPA